MLNDDIEVTTPNWLERMVMYSEREDIGAVGAKLLWSDTRLQHVGVDFEAGLPHHTYRGFGGDFDGYANSVRIARNCLAVTGACLMTRADVFRAAGGLSKTLPVNFNDIDYCLKVYSAGRRIVYDPDLVLNHFESSSRDPVVDSWEIEQTGRPLGGGSPRSDPYVNPNVRRGMPRLTAYLGWAARRPPRPAALLGRGR